MSRTTPEDKFRVWAFHTYAQVLRGQGYIPLAVFAGAVSLSSKPARPGMEEAWRAAQADVSAANRLYRTKKISHRQFQTRVAKIYADRLGIEVGEERSLPDDD